ncbi:hypothetical protein [Rhodococcus sp. B10]|uniref:hypothetical protein n=1 Tax=Rhodococcus sp. B10 TaxID=2695876 RepID=UPI00142F4D83|nr:hypothetical protein [Rhodococcus sp. B10]NIL77639.1 hypothetical protein [Rhodococcus sp. B10]
MSVETDLTALLRDHVCRYFGPASSDDASNCECGWWGENYPAHVASVVSAAYTLTPKEPEPPAVDIELERPRLKVMHAQEQRDREYRHPETDWQHQYAVDHALAEAQDALAKYYEARRTP